MTKHLINAAENTPEATPPPAPAHQLMAAFIVTCGNDSLSTWVAEDFAANRGRGVLALL